MTDKPLPTKEERRARRAERRLKQRDANVDRAARMQKARLGSTTNVETSIPPRINVGCSGWYYWHWKGLFYPDTLDRRGWFPHYMDHFNTVELNAPFYSWPTMATVQGWNRQTANKPFIYTVKVSELITHVREFAGTKTLVQDFGYIADLLGPRMGCFLFQLPARYHYVPVRLKSIVKQLDPARRNVVEFRHTSWWNERVYAAFEEAGIIFCSCSGPKLPDELIKTADDIYIRFHGTNQWYRHDYSDAELQVWARRIKESGAKRIWSYFNNDRNGFAIRNARRFSQILE